MRTESDAACALPRNAGTPLRSLLWCIRFDEVIVLQGAPLLGACFAVPNIDLAALTEIMMLMVGNLCLVAHVFVLNDWAGIDGDLRDPNRASSTFLAQGVRRSDFGALALALLALSLLLFALVSAAACLIAVAIAGLSALYSHPSVHGKGRNLFGSALHLSGGTLHFLLGVAAFPPLSWPSVALGCYFGLVFAAGHLTHEARDYDSDLLNGIRTNAVAFGRSRVVRASLALFTLAYALLAALALAGFAPRVLAAATLLYPLHLHATLQAFRHGLGFDALRRLQQRYRRIHVVIGLAMLATALPWQGRISQIAGPPHTSAALPASGAVGKEAHVGLAHNRGKTEASHMLTPGKPGSIGRRRTDMGCVIQAGAVQPLIVGGRPDAAPGAPRHD